MSINAGEPFVNQHVQRKFARIVLNNAAGTFTIDSTLTDPALVGKCEVVTSGVAGTLLSEQTFTGANATTAIGVGLLDGLAAGPVTGDCVAFVTSTGSTVLMGTMTSISGQTIAGVTSSKNVAVLTNFGATIAAQTGKVIITLHWT